MHQWKAEYVIKHLPSYNCSMCECMCVGAVHMCACLWYMHMYVSVCVCVLSSQTSITPRLFFQLYSSYIGWESVEVSELAVLEFSTWGNTGVRGKTIKFIFFSLFSTLFFFFLSFPLSHCTTLLRVPGAFCQLAEVIYVETHGTQRDCPHLENQQLNSSLTQVSDVFSKIVPQNAICAY